MYEAYYGFEEKPFTLSPDPKYLFLSGTHREVLGHLLYGIEQGEGFMAISGEVGTGKTTLCRTLLDRLGASCEIAFLFNPTLTPTDLIKAINGEFGLSTFGDSRPELLDVLNTFLLDQNALGRRVLVIIDEAQNLPGETLEQLRLLSNLESRTAKLLQIILIGQPELDETLEASELRQLRQRITVWWRLGPLAEGETGEYVRHRLRVASGGSDRPIFSDAALARVHRMSGGVPRLVNVLCDRALLAGFAAQASEITPAIVNEAAAEMRLGRRGESLPARSVGDRAARWRRRLALAAGLAAAVAVGAVVGWSLRRGTPPAPPPPVAAAAPAIALPAPAPPQVAAPAVAAEEEPPAEAPDEPLLWDDPLDNLFALEPPRATNGRALAAMLDAWGLPSADPGEPSFPQALATLEESGLQVLRVASLDEILALGLPALVELRDADGQLRAVLVRHVEDAGIQLEGLVPDQPVRVTRIRLEGRFRGNGYVAWRNYEGLPPVLRAGGSGDPVRFVQRSLSRLGFYAGDVHGSFDPATEKAVVAFQDGSGIATDGALGPVSQVHLYQSLPDYRMPTLALGAVRAAVD